MPIKPKSSETEQEFISRCIGEEINAGYEQDQAAAICYSKWEKQNMATEDIQDNIDELETETSQGFAYANKESKEFATLPTTDCMEKHKSAGYTEEYSKMACSKTVNKDEGQQGGVVAMSEEFARKKFEYSPNAKENLNDFMARCMGDDMVREKKKDRGMRAGFCYSQYQQRYIASLAKGWK
jgi:uncharacterized protein YdaT